jgi:hypothetical protein
MRCSYYLKEVVHPFSYLTVDLEVGEEPPSPLSIDFPLTVVDKYEVGVQHQQLFYVDDNNESSNGDCSKDANEA